MNTQQECEPQMGMAVCVTPLTPKLMHVQDTAKVHPSELHKGGKLRIIQGLQAGQHATEQCSTADQARKLLSSCVCRTQAS